MKSQDTIIEGTQSTFPIDTTDTRPIIFPFWMAKAVALDLEEKKQLELESQLYALEIETLEALVKTTEKTFQQHLKQKDLLKKKISLLEIQLQGKEKVTKETGALVWYCRLLFAFSVGFLLAQI